MKFLVLALFPFLLSAQPSSAPAHSESEAREIIDSLYAKLLAGADFAKTASRYSEDPGTRAQGGLLNNAKEESFVPEFSSALQQLKPMEISTPFKTPYGYHIAQLISRNGNLLTLRH